MSLIFGVFYFLMIATFIAGWLKIPIFKRDKKIYENDFVSVIVAARNEQKNIANLLDELVNQKLPKKYYEVIIVDDFSEDRTAEIIKKYQDINSNVKYLRQNKGEKGKKSALKKGILQAKGNLIVTTDADCRVGEEWLFEILAFYQKFKPKMIIATVAFYQTKKLLTFNNLQALEFLSLIISGAGACGINRPIMNNGANLAFEKQAFMQLSDPFSEKFASGDDMLFMLKIKKKFPKSIQFLKSEKAIVYTDAQKTLKSFVNQRIRWTSKSKAYKDFDVILVGLIILFVNFLILLNLLLSPFDRGFFIDFLIIFCLKTAIDFLFFAITSKFFHSQKLLWLFVPLQIIYSFYVFGIGIVGFFSKFTWKGRQY